MQLVPQAADPRGQLRNILAALRQYEQFVDGAYPNPADDVAASEADAAAYWMVTARYGDDDGFDRFIQDGSWSLPEPGRFSDMVRSMQPGDQIAMRDYHHQLHDLPFNGNGKRVSAMRIRATGTIVDNPGDGVSVTVEWTTLDAPRTWYFYTNNETIWLLDGSKEPGDRLIRFAFDGEPQDYDWWLARPYWQERLFGDSDADRIRQFVVDSHIAPARQRGEQTVTVNVRAVNDALGLREAWPNICQALSGRKMMLLTGLAEPQRDGKPMSSATSFTFNLRSTEVIHPTNLILYGPPGTGKTFATAEHAVRLCGEDTSGLDRAAVMERYRALEAQQRIRFVTFHQSYAYEDFVEGLRPTTGTEGEEASGGFRLEPRPGVFREISALAEQASKAAQAGGAPFDIRDRQVFKMSLGRAGAEDHIFDAAIEGEYVVLGWGGDIDWTPYDSYEAVHARWNEDHPGTSGNDSNITQVYRFRCSMKVGDLVVISYGNTRFRAIGEIVGDYEYAPTEIRDYAHRRRVRWLYQPDEPMPVSFYAKPFTMRSCYMLREEHLNREALALLLPGSGGAPGAPKQFVLICDEINRGNISKVFGELITLLEPDKRLGETNEIKVRLPYSGDTFGVPANLHIIGTMNTADRSIALIDKALRRRFTFTEMMPLPDLPELATAGDAAGVDLPGFLRALNEGIEYLLDREHQIGHAWLLGCDSREKLDAAMRERIIPLIAEYFFEDWGKVADVLGGRENNPFLERITLRAPLGYRDEEPRYRWRVREAFADDAYARVIGA